MAGRPKDAEKNKEILAIASTLFLEKGFQQTSMEAVAKKAGVSKQTIYSHFQNKESLLQAVVAYKVDQYLFADIDFNNNIELSAQLYKIACNFLNLLLDPEAIAMQRLIICEAQRYPQLGRLFFEVAPKPLLEFVMHLLQHYQDQKKLDIDDIALASESFLSSVKGVLHLELLVGICEHISQERIDRQIHYTIKNFLKLHQVKEDQ